MIMAFVTTCISKEPVLISCRKQEEGIMGVAQGCTRAFMGEWEAPWKGMAQGCTRLVVMGVAQGCTQAFMGEWEAPWKGVAPGLHPSLHG